MFKKLALAATLAFAALTAPTHAATFKPSLSDGGNWYLSITGTITLTDGITARNYAAAFKAKGITDVTVMLDSPGGNVLGGLGVAATVWANDWDTIVGPDTLCASMCADIWLAGSSRYAFPDSHIGLHSAGRKVGKASKSRMVRGDNSMRITMLKKFGVSNVAIGVMVTTDPNDMFYLTPANAKVMDIDYTVLGADKPKPTGCPIGSHPVKSSISASSTCVPY